MTVLHGQSVFEKGDELFVRFPEKPKETVRVVAVPMIKDSDVCYGCIFYKICRKYPGNKNTPVTALLPGTAIQQYSKKLRNNKECSRAS